MISQKQRTAAVTNVNIKPLQLQKYSENCFESVASLRLRTLECYDTRYCGLLNAPGPESGPINCRLVIYFFLPPKLEGVVSILRNRSVLNITVVQYSALRPMIDHSRLLIPAINCRMPTCVICWCRATESTNGRSNNFVNRTQKKRWKSINQGMGTSGKPFPLHLQLKKTSF